MSSFNEEINTENFKTPPLDYMMEMKSEAMEAGGAATEELPSGIKCCFL